MSKDNQKRIVSKCCGAESGNNYDDFTDIEVCYKCGKPFEPKEEVVECCKGSCSCHHPSDCECNNQCFFDGCICKCHTPPLEVKEGSKDIEWEKEFDKEFTDLEGKEDVEDEYWNVVTNDIKIKSFISSLLSQQEAKIKRELIEKIEKNEGCLYSGDVNYIIKLLNE